MPETRRGNGDGFLAHPSLIPPSQGGERVSGGYGLCTDAMGRRVGTAVHLTAMSFITVLPASSVTVVETTLRPTLGVTLSM